MTGALSYGFEPGDPEAADVAALLAESEAYSRSLYPPEGVHMLDVRELAKPSVRFLVARSPAGVAEGCGAYVDHRDGSAELKRLFVKPEARGKGLGALILRRLEDEARHAGVRVMRLETGPLQREALGLYRRFGYTDRSPFGDYRPDPSSLFMEKALNALVPFGVLRGDLQGRLVLLKGREPSSILFSKLAEDVLDKSEVLARTGLGPGACVGLMGENCYEWLVHDLALMSLGCVPVCFPVDEFALREPQDLAQTYDLALLLVTKKVASARRLPWIGVVDDPDAATPSARTPLGRGLHARIQGTDVCTVIFSSGTSGQLKALLLSRAGVEDTIAALVNDWSMTQGDAILVALPLSIFQQRLMVYAALRADTDILLTDSGNLFRALKTMRPTIVLGPPALFESVEKRFLAEPSLRRATRTLASHALAVVPGEARRARLRRRLFSFADDALGGRSRVLITGSAPSKPSTLAFFQRAGLPLFEAYGLAEAGFIAWNRPVSQRVGSVGRPIAPGSVTIAEDGEILLALPHPQALGYFGVESSEQARTFLCDGRIATGDLGRIDADGFLHITGRKKSVIVTQSGEKVNPEPLERVLGGTPGVERIVVVGGGNIPGLVAVVAIDPRADAAREAELRAAMQRTLDELNERVSRVSRIGRFVVTRVPFQPETGLVTRNLKLDRQAIHRFFEAELLRPEAQPP